MNGRQKRICFSSSSGGHFEQLMMLKPLMEKYDSYIVTEKLDYASDIKDIPVFYVTQINRTDRLFLLKFAWNAVKSLWIVLMNRPDAVISTGALAAVWVMLWTKLFGGKVIYIESFAKISSPTLSGRIAYRIADQFYVQWESMKKFYPKALCKGGIY